MAVPLCIGYLMAHASAHGTARSPAATWQPQVVAAIDARAMAAVSASATLLIVADRGLALAIGAAGARGRAGLRRDALAGRDGAVERRAPWWIGGWRRGRRRTRVLAQLDRGATSRGRVLSGDPAVVAVAGRLRSGATRYPSASRFLADRHRGRDFPDVDGRVPAEQSGRDLQPGAQPLPAGRGRGRTARRRSGAARRSRPSRAPRGAASRRIDPAMFWMRAGAACGLCGVAVQSFWETG